MGQDGPTSARQQAPDRAVLWTRANVMEVLPELPSPYTLSTLIPMLDKTSRIYYGRLLAPEAELGPTLADFDGRPYINLSQYAHVGGFVRISPAALMRDIGHVGELPPQASRPVKVTLGQFLVALPTMLRMGGQRFVQRRLLRRNYERLEAEKGQFASTDLDSMSDEAIWHAIEGWHARSPRYLTRVTMILTTISAELLRPLEAICRWVGFSVHRLLDAHLAIGQRTVSGQAAFDLLALARAARADNAVRTYFAVAGDLAAGYRERLVGTDFLRMFDHYLTNYGHRGPYESDLALPRYREDPTPLLSAIRNHVLAQSCPNPADIETRQRQLAADVWAEFSKTMRRWQKPFVGRAVRLLLARGKVLYVDRERARSDYMRVDSEVRRWLLVLADRFAGRGWIEAASDFFYLQGTEIAAAVEHSSETDRLVSLAKLRRRQQEERQCVAVPIVGWGTRFGPCHQAVPSTPTPSSRVVLHGQCISAGTAEGIVAVIREPTNFSQMEQGAILVAPGTDPAWTPLFTLAAGVVVEAGGALSHAAIVAREFGLPALANVEHATTLLRTGDVVRLDATGGVVEVVQETLRA